MGEFLNHYIKQRLHISWNLMDFTMLLPVYLVHGIRDNVSCVGIRTESLLVFLIEAVLILKQVWFESHNQSGTTFEWHKAIHKIRVLPAELSDLAIHYYTSVLSMII
jgi:hypothetical protein